MKEVSLKILDIECAACVSRLDRALVRVPGVKKAVVNYASSCAVISYDEVVCDIDTITEKVRKSGFRVPVEEADLIPASQPENPCEIIAALNAVYGVKGAFFNQDGSITVSMWPIGLDLRDLILICREKRLEVALGEIRGGDEDQEIKKRMGLLKQLILSAACTAPLLMEFSPKVQFALGTVEQFGPGSHFYKGAIRALKNKTFGMDFLVSLSSTLIYLYSSYISFTRRKEYKLYFMSNGVLISLILFGKYMEQVATGETNSAIRKLMHLQPKTAMVEKDGIIKETPLDKVYEGNIILVRPGERIPVDGKIVYGSCAVDESMLTGESMPISKGVGDSLIGGSMNRSGSVKISATALGKASVLQQIIEIVRKAQSEKAPVQRFADRVAQWFVPAVVGSAALTFSAWYFIVKPKDFEKALLCCCDVLSVACPCALGLATPTGLMVGSGAAAEKGILFKRGVALENAYKADTVVLDKTGTLTKGCPDVTDIHTVYGVSLEDFIALCAALEYHSSHPLADAVTNYFETHFNGVSLPEVQNFEHFPGKGVEGIINGKRHLLGSRRFLAENGINLSALKELCDLRNDAKTEVCLACEGSLRGVMGIADVLKEEAAEAVKHLIDSGKEVWMLTGDNEQTAKAIAQRAGISNVLSEILPGEKASAIEALKQQGKNVCMVGDGVNDTPALAVSDCSVAMGSGSDIAIDSADILLPSGNLKKLKDVFGVSKATVKTIHQNLHWALFYNAISIPVAALGVLHPSICATAMSLSSIGVLMHSLSLKRLSSNKEGEKWKRRY